jgi:hypothetical protein
MILLVQTQSSSVPSASTFSLDHWMDWTGLYMHVRVREMGTSRLSGPAFLVGGDA